MRDPKPTTIILYLAGRDEIRLSVDRREWKEQFEKALREGGALHVNDPETEEMMGVNPRMVLYWKTAP